MEEAPKLAHSFSSLELADSCPKKFYHLRVAKDYKEEEGDATITGKVEHKHFEDRLKEGTPLPPHLEKHEDKFTTLLDSGLIVKAEEEFTINKEFEPCESWWHPDAFLRVKADVALYSETTAAVLDWKTGKRRPKSFQLELGALMQMIHYPKIKSTEAAFLWIKEDASDRYTFTRADDFDRIKNKLLTKVERVEDMVADGVWQAKPGYHCNWCPVRKDCSYSQARN